MRKLLPYMRKYIGFALLSPLMMILEVFGDVLIPYLMSRIVDIGIANRDINYIVKTGGLMVVVALLGMTFGIISAHAGARAGYGFAAEIRKAVFKKIQSFSFANLDKFSVSSLITRVTNDCNILGQVTMMSLRMAIRAPFLMTMALIMSFRINPYLARVFMVAIPFTALSVGLILFKAGPLFRKLQHRVDRVNAVIQENLTGIRVVKAFNRQEFEEEKFQKRNDALKDTALRAISIIILLFPILNLTIYSTIIAVLWFGGRQVVAGTMGSGELISFITYIIQVLISLMMISFFFMQLMRGIASGGRIIEVLETESEIKEPLKGATELKDGSIIFKDVNFIYPGSRERTLKDINFHVASGETLGIVGSTGSSKTTLVQLIPRLYDVTEGSVIVGGRDVREYDLVALREQVAFVLQKNTLFSGTLRENMQWGKRDATDEEIIEALKKAQAWEFVSKYEDGLDHWVEQGGANFSGGQRQRLCIARALLKSPKILILDDSTSAVDMTTDAQIQKVFKEELKDVTKIIIAQRISSIEKADKILVMHEGRLEAIGDHKTLLDTSPIYREIYESQQKGVIKQ